MIAIWQAIYPDSYTTSQVNAEGTFTDAPGAIEDSDTSLTPFHSDAGNTLYTSTTARYTRAFGYTYPEIVDWGVNTTQLSSNVRTNLNKLYNPAGGKAAKRGISAGPKHTDTVSNTTYHQYFVNIRVDKAALKAPFFIHFFLGEPDPRAPDKYSWAPNLVASHSVLYSGIIPTPGNTTFTTTYGQIPLNHALLAASNSSQESNSTQSLMNLDPSRVVPFLGKNLVWKVQKYDDTVIPTNCSELKSLTIFVVGRRVIHRRTAKDDSFPAYGRLVIHRKATRGKIGGIRVGEAM